MTTSSESCRLECTCLHDRNVILTTDLLNGETAWRFRDDDIHPVPNSGNVDAGVHHEEDDVTANTLGKSSLQHAKAPLGLSHTKAKPLEFHAKMLTCTRSNPNHLSECSCIFMIELDDLSCNREHLMLHINISVHSAEQTTTAADSYCAFASSTSRCSDCIEELLNNIQLYHDYRATALPLSSSSSCDYKMSVHLCDAKLRCEKPTVVVAVLPRKKYGQRSGGTKKEESTVRMTCYVTGSPLHLTLPNPVIPSGGFRDIRRIYTCHLGSYAQFAVPVHMCASFYRICVVPKNIAEPFWWPSLYLSHTRAMPTCREHHWRSHAHEGSSIVSTVLDCRRWKDYCPRVCFFSVLCARERKSEEMHKYEAEIDANQGVYHGVSSAVPTISLGLPELPRAVVVDEEGGGVPQTALAFAEFEVLVEEIFEGDKWGGRWKRCAEIWNDIFENPDMDGMALSLADPYREINHPGLAYAEMKLMPFLHLLDVAMTLMDCTVKSKTDNILGNFYDLGSGNGGCTMAAAMAELGFHRCVGIELLSSLHGAAVRAKEAYDQHRLHAATKANWSDVYFLCESIEDVKWEYDARLVFTQSYALPCELQDLISERVAAGLRRGCGLLISSSEDTIMDAEVKAGNFISHRGPELKSENTFDAGLQYTLYVKIR